MRETVKTSFVLPRDLYLELKKRAAEEGRPVKELVVEALVEYLYGRRGDRARERLIRIITSPVEVGGPEDLEEYEYHDV